MDFEQACKQAAAYKEPEGGIGVLAEKTVHAALKWWLDDNPAHHEVLLPEGSIADIFDGHRVTEVQTAGFSAFRPKLQRLLAHYPVTVVHPVIRQKWLAWLSPETGEVTKPRRSSRMGGFFDAGRELVYLLPCLGHENLTIQLVLLDVEECRLADGWGRGGKRGSHRVSREPLCLCDTVTLSDAASYAALLPPSLPASFTTADFSKAARLRGRALSGTLKVLLARDVVQREKQGRTWVYHTIGHTDGHGQA
ncbi:MAG: hypothetical protein IIX61_01870 [Loktanella sp.]|nr:hypothetical protein [Loktanella sp.]